VLRLAPEMESRDHRADACDGKGYDGQNVEPEGNHADLRR